MAKEIDDDVPIYFSPGDEAHDDEIVEVDRKELLEDKAPLEKEWSRYQPAKTLEQAAEEADKRGEKKIKGLRNRSLRDTSVENSGTHEKVEGTQVDIEADRNVKSSTLESFLRRSGRFLKPNLIKPGEEQAAETTSSTQTAVGQSAPRSIANMRAILVITCVNVFFAGFWCGSFLFPNNRVVTTLRDVDANETSGNASSNAGSQGIKGNRSIADAVAKLNPVVVNIDIRAKRPGASEAVAPYRPVQKFFEPIPYENERQIPHGMPVHAQASGVLISKDGYILTSNHVVAPGTDIRVTLFDRREFQGSVIGRDAFSDLAVIKIGGSNLPMARFADSKKVRVGDWAIAIGSPFGFDHTVTAGLISGVNRVVSEFSNNIPLIQTDAQISPGNSGGPLANLDGEVIGIVCAAGNRGTLGINWAVPSNTVCEVAKKLIEKGSMGRPFLGLYMDDFDPDRKKAQTLPVHSVMVVVANVVRGGPADKANLIRGDIIQAVNAGAVKSSQEVREILHSLRPGDIMEFVIRRPSSNNNLMTKRVKLENYPESN